MSGLPLTIQPCPGEGWHSYLTRVAQRHGATVAAIADEIGVRENRRWPANHGIAMAPERAAPAAAALHIDPAHVSAMQLARYDRAAFDLSPLKRSDLDPLAATRQIVHTSWIHLAGSKYCPACLAPAGVWQLEWRLPWITTCPTHHTWLEHRCPQCEGVPGLYNSRLHSTAPSRTFAATDGRLCDLPGAQQDTACAADLSRTPARHAPAEAIATSAGFRSLIENGRGTFAGEPHPSLQVLRAWQASIGIAVALKRCQVDSRVRNHRWTTPPRDAQTVQNLVDAAAPVMRASTIEDAANILLTWCAQAGISTPHRDTFARATQPSVVLQPAIDAALDTVGRAHTRLRRRAPRQGVITVVPWDPSDVPQLIWPCALPPELRTSTRPDSRLLRCVVSMACVRMCTGDDWAACGAELRIPPDKARNWTRYCYSSRFPGLKDALLESALTTAAVLPRQPRRHRWRRRPAIGAAHGVTSLTHAQTPSCARVDPRSTWCPCLARTE